MTPIRVLQVFTIMDRGGAESMIMNYYRKIDRSKIQFDFLVHRNKKAAYDDEIKALGGNIYKLPSINPFYPKSYYKKLRALFDAHNDYSIVHSHINTFSCFPLKIAREFNIPCRIAHAHIALDTFSLRTIIRNNVDVSEVLKHIIKLFLRRRINKYPTHYFSCGQKAGNWLFGNTSFERMNNAIDSEKFQYNSEIEKEYKEKFNLKESIVIGHIGRFDSQKNHSFLLNIFAQLLKKNPNSKLILIGEGPLKRKIENEAKNLAIYEDIFFLGVRDDIVELLQTMDVFVFPSIYEGLPVTLIEAQSSGTPILAADTISEEVKITDLIEFISLDKSPEFWAEKIMDIKKNNMPKADTKNLIIGNGYDIISNVNKLQDFYLQQNTNK
ncbi:glycosyltransferase family 1 protein [Gaetbulibacter aquiaggeris]|uniref:Glycosyltransferase family 1 protein n=1 Tax=Gaetbulibacter aquiaggeris TaxID=1735373 RepID=A0ABW7MQY4_9FLAO